MSKPNIIALFEGPKWCPAHGAFFFSLTVNPDSPQFQSVGEYLDSETLTDAQKTEMVQALAQDMGIEPERIHVIELKK